MLVKSTIHPTKSTQLLQKNGAETVTSGVIGEEEELEENLITAEQKGKNPEDSEVQKILKTKGSTAPKEK